MITPRFRSLAVLALFAAVSAQPSTLLPAESLLTSSEILIPMAFVPTLRSASTSVGGSILVPTGNGRFELTIPVPSSPSLAGAILSHQGLHIGVGQPGQPQPGDRASVLRPAALRPLQWTSRSLAAGAAAARDAGVAGRAASAHERPPLA
ncbi:MAG: hypothetical protein AAF628_20380 [Planctomycetota bacterium]